MMKTENLEIKKYENCGCKELTTSSKGEKERIPDGPFDRRPPTLSPSPPLAEGGELDEDVPRGSIGLEGRGQRDHARGGRPGVPQQLREGPMGSVGGSLRRMRSLGSKEVGCGWTRGIQILCQHILFCFFFIEEESGKDTIHTTRPRQPGHTWGRRAERFPERETERSRTHAGTGCIP